MNIEFIRSTVLSTGIACILSAPISGAAMRSWEIPEQPKSEYMQFCEAQKEAQDNMEKIAAAKKRKEENRQLLIQAEIDRQNYLATEAEYVLETYGVDLPEDIKDYCEAAGQEFCICPELLEAICWRESGFDHNAVNEGCLGIMQISVRWHRDRMKSLGVTDIYDTEGNIRVGASYLAELFEKHEGDLDEVLKEYNGDTSKGVSAYAIEIMQVSEALERVHGK